MFIITDDDIGLPSLLLQQRQVFESTDNGSYSRVDPAKGRGGLCGADERGNGDVLVGSFFRRVQEFGNDGIEDGAANVAGSADAGNE